MLEHCKYYASSTAARGTKIHFHLVDLPATRIELSSIPLVNFSFAVIHKSYSTWPNFVAWIFQVIIIRVKSLRLFTEPW